MFTARFGVRARAVFVAAASAALAAAGLVPAIAITAAGASGVNVPLAGDTWSRTVGSGWGSADAGGPYANKPGEQSSFAANGNTATMRVPAAGTSRQSWLPAIAAEDVDVAVSVASDTTPTGPFGQTVAIQLRRQGANVEYRARLRFATDGSVHLAATKVTGTTSEALIGPEVTVPGVTATPGVALRMRADVSGTSPTTLLRASGARPTPNRRRGSSRVPIPRQSCRRPARSDSPVT